MGFILRMITGSRWYDLDDDSWVPSGDIHGDPLSDFRTRENVLSVWFIENDKSNLERVAAAYATSRGKLDQIDFVLLPDNLLPPDIQMKAVAAKTCDKIANECWHRDLVQLTGQRIVALARQFYREGYKKEEMGRYDHSYIATLIKQGIERSEIDPKRLSAKLRTDIESVA
jgi:hypothetical protein